MLLIRCPYCEEERPELEFRHAGEAHLVRPSDVAAMSDEDFEGYFFIRENARGSSTSAGGTCMAAGASSTRCATASATGS